jgi:hypothetical protein
MQRGFPESEPTLPGGYCIQIGRLVIGEVPDDERDQLPLSRVKYAGVVNHDSKKEHCEFVGATI